MFKANNIDELLLNSSTSTPTRIGGSSGTFQLPTDNYWIQGGTGRWEMTNRCDSTWDVKLDELNLKKSPRYGSFSGRYTCNIWASANTCSVS